MSVKQTADAFDRGEKKGSGSELRSFELRRDGHKCAHRSRRIARPEIKRCQTGECFDSDGAASLEWSLQCARTDENWSLDTIASLKYSPSVYVVELRRANGGSVKRRSDHLSALARGAARRISNQGVDLQDSLRQTGRLHLLKRDYSQVRCLIAHLRMDLEKLRTINGRC